MKVKKKKKKEEEKEKETGTVVRVRAVRVEIAKPLDIQWRELDDLLRDRRAVMHRLLNAGVLHIASQRWAGNEKPRALEAIKAELSSWQTWCAEMGAKTKDEKERIRHERRATMTLASSITDALQQRCVDADQRWRKNKGNARLPTAKRGAPIFIRDGGWTLESDKNGWILSMRLEGVTPTNHRPGKVRVALRPSSGKHHGILQQMVKGSVKIGNCQVVLDESTGKWYAILAFTEELNRAAPPRDGTKTLIVHRGQRNFMYALCTDGRTRILRGNKFAAQRLHLKRRAEAFKRVSAFERGAGAKGHGTRRRYETHDALDRKLKRVVHTYCQTSAAWVFKAAKDLGCGRILIEDYGGIEQSDERAERRFLDHFPYYQLGTAIKWVCKREQLELLEGPAAFISQTCPRCKHQDARQHNTRTGVFHCINPDCGFDRPADWVAAFNQGIAFGIDMSEIKKILAAQERVAAEIKKKAKAA